MRLNNVQLIVCERHETNRSRKQRIANAGNYLDETCAIDTFISLLEGPQLAATSTGQCNIYSLSIEREIFVSVGIYVTNLAIQEQLTYQTRCPVLMQN